MSNALDELFRSIRRLVNRRHKEKYIKNGRGPTFKYKKISEKPVVRPTAEVYAYVTERRMLF